MQAVSHKTHKTVAAYTDPYIAGPKTRQCTSGMRGGRDSADYCQAPGGWLG